MPKNELESRQMSKDEAMAVIESVIDACSRMGANDFEIPTLKQLEELVRDGKIDPVEAVRQAESILAVKQNYH